MQIPGVPAKHAIITDECRRNKGDAAVIEEALGRLREEWKRIAAGWPVGNGGRFHVVLTVERPPKTQIAPGFSPSLVPPPLADFPITIDGVVQ